jgi:ParB family transcriptional regulator, chromosome partitioning protein
MSTIKDKLAASTSKLALPRENTEEGHPADVNDHQSGDFFQVNVEDILPNPDQPRQYFDPVKMEELAESIRQKGVLQPIIIRFGEERKIYLVAGERRWRASKMAGIEKIPAMLTKDNPAEIALIENLQRENLSPVEEAEALGRMIKEYNYTQDKLALVVGKARTSITEMLSLNKLPNEIKSECRMSDKFSKSVLLEISKLGTVQEMIELFDVAKSGRFNVKNIRQITRKQSRERRAPIKITLSQIGVLIKQLNRINKDFLEEDDRANLKTALIDLKIYIGKVLD